MNLSVGIVGLPNVGKSTLFNALLKKQQAFVANYPFATIEPNIGIVPVPDERLERLAEIIASEFSGPVTTFPPASARSEYSPLANNSLRAVGSPSSRATRNFPPIVPAVVKFVDIAGLVKGAAEGAGLGNKFLSHIREVSVIAHVVRVFEDENVIREGSSDPEEDFATVQTELMISDVQTLTKALDQRKLPNDQKQVIQKALDRLDKGIPIRDAKYSEEEMEILHQYFLLSAKPEIVVLNISEDEYSLVNVAIFIDKYSVLLQLPKDRFVVICAKIESELAALSEEEQRQYLSELGFPTSGLERLIKKAYQQLGLISFLTAGEKEVRAWTLRADSTALKASSVIHTDFEKKFIKAEVATFEDFVQFGGWKGAREKGKTKLEGRDYIVKDGDVIEFKIGT